MPAFDEVRTLMRQGHLIAAQQEAAKNYRYFAGRNIEWAWKFRLLQANVLIMRGLSQEVLALVNPSLPAELDNGDLEIQKQMLQGLAYANLGRYSDSESRLDEAGRRCAARASSLTPEVVTARGVLESRRDRPDKAEQYFRQALELIRQQGDGFLEAAGLLNLGVAAMKQEHFDEAISWSSAARDLSQSLGAGLTLEKALGNLGWIYYKMGDFEKSLAFYREAQNGAHDLGVVIDEVRWSNNLGLVYFETNQPEIAESLYRQSLTLADATQNREQIIDALTALAFVTLRRGNLELAEKYSRRSFEMAHGDGAYADRAAELYPLLVEGQLAVVKKDPERAQQIFTEIAHDPKSDISLRWEAQHALAHLSEDRSQIGAADKQYREALNTFETARSRLQNEDARLPFLTNAFRLYDDYIRFLLGHGKVEEALQVADYSRARTLAEGLRTLKNGTSFQPSASAFPQLAKRLGATILFYWLGEKRSYLWAVTAQRVSLFPLPSATEVENSVEAYRKDLLGPRDVLETGNVNGFRLYSTLIAPARRLIPENARVVIIPDGKLNNLNFETLLVSEPKPHYWIEDVTLASTSSLRLLAAAQFAKAKAKPKLLLVGDPPSSDPNYPLLANAAAEVEDVRKHFADADQTVFVRDRATPPAYLQSQPQQFTYIHFVAHGTASRLSPLDSAVVLSRSSTEQDSFKLYARDILRHPLRAELVTISACYTSGSRAYVGEGLVGLSWAFLRAGAHNVIGALWEVSDSSTPRLMDQMYSELAKGYSPEAALRTAKLALLHSDGVFRKPLYWAPFQLYVGS